MLDHLVTRGLIFGGNCPPHTGVHSSCALLRPHQQHRVPSFPRPPQPVPSDPFPLPCLLHGTDYLLHYNTRFFTLGASAQLQPQC